MAIYSAIYQITLYDKTGNRLAIIDDYRSFQFQKIVNNKGYFSLILNANDSKVPFFETMGILEVKRKIPGVVDWYTEFIGHCEDFYTNIYQNGNEQYTVVGSGLNGMLNQRIIAWYEGTAYAAKNDVCETVMKEYVYENAGNGALATSGRFANGVFTNFTVMPDLLRGPNWKGDRSGKNLLSVLQEISNYSGYDFYVYSNTIGTYNFEVYPDQLGKDRTITGLNTTTGLNAAGNPPHIFAQSMGNVQTASLSEKNRDSTNRVYAYGQGTGTTRQIACAEDSSLFDAITNLNLREGMRGGSSQSSLLQLADLANEQLEKTKTEEKFEFEPTDIPPSLYGVHYFLGDRVTTKIKNTISNKRIVSVKISLSGGKGESNKTFEFEDITS